MFLCRQTKRKELEEGGNPESEKIEARDNGINNNGMDKDDIESDPKRFSL